MPSCENGAYYLSTSAVHGTSSLSSSAGEVNFSQFLPDEFLRLHSSVVHTARLVMIYYLVFSDIVLVNDV